MQSEVGCGAAKATRCKETGKSDGMLGEWIGQLSLFKSLGTWRGGKLGVGVLEGSIRRQRDSRSGCGCEAKNCVFGKGQAQCNGDPSFRRSAVGPERTSTFARGKA